MEKDHQQILKASIKAVAKLEALIDSEKMPNSVKKKLISIKDDLNEGVEGKRQVKQEEDPE